MSSSSSSLETVPCVHLVLRKINDLWPDDQARYKLEKLRSATYLVSLRFTTHVTAQQLLELRRSAIHHTNAMKISIDPGTKTIQIDIETSNSVVRKTGTLQDNNDNITCQRDVCWIPGRDCPDLDDDDTVDVKDAVKSKLHTNADLRTSIYALISLCRALVSHGPPCNRLTSVVVDQDLNRPRGVGVYFYGLRRISQVWLEQMLLCLPTRVHTCKLLADTGALLVVLNGQAWNQGFWAVTDPIQYCSDADAKLHEIATNLERVYSNNNNNKRQQCDIPDDDDDQKSSPTKRRKRAALS